MRILVTAPFSDRNRQRLISAAGHEDICFEGSDDSSLDKADIIIGNPSAEELKAAKNLKYLQLTNAGTDRYNESREILRNVVFCNMSGAFGGIIAEYILAGILTMYRKFPKYIKQQENGIWKDAGSELCLMGKKALILGAGDIGTNTAIRLKAFGVRTAGIRRVEREKPQCFDEMYTLEKLDRVIGEADIVIGCLPSTAKTAGLMDEKRLKRMKKGSMLVNAGRGSLVVTDDLVKVLESGHLFGAVLDVTDPEPLPADHPLWKVENVLITPHVSGITFGHTPELEDKAAEICCRNLKKYISGERPDNVVDMNNGYRETQL